MPQTLRLCAQDQQLYQRFWQPASQKSVNTEQSAALSVTLDWTCHDRKYMIPISAIWQENRGGSRICQWRRTINGSQGGEAPWSWKLFVHFRTKKVAKSLGFKWKFAPDCFALPWPALIFGQWRRPPGPPIAGCATARKCAQRRSTCLTNHLTFQILWCAALKKGSCSLAPSSLWWHDA